MSTLQLLSSCSPEPKDLSSYHTLSLSPTMRDPVVNHVPVRNSKPVQINNIATANTKHQKLPSINRKNIALNFTKYAKENILQITGYKKMKTISPSLQGDVFVAIKTPQHKDSLLVYGYMRCNISPSSIIPEIMNICYNYMQSEPHVVIKSANKKLHSNKRSKNGVSQLKEDIVQEAHLMHTFAQNNAPKSMIQLRDFLEDEHNYYLVMEEGGIGLFEFVVECHQLIANKQLSLKEWKKTVRFMFSKMVKVIHWMHVKAHCCNLDISLENIVMGKDTHFDAETGTIKQLEIRFIDFGVSEMFDTNNIEYICSKYVGKNGYKPPKVFRMEPFAANKADIWSLGMCLFMMSVGAPIYKNPNSFDTGFQILKQGKLKLMLQCWNRLDYIGKNQYDLLTNMLCIDEMQRYSIDDTMKHDWIKSYFQKRKSSRDDIISLQNERRYSFKKENRNPSIQESETNFLFDHNACCDDDL